MRPVCNKTHEGYSISARNHERHFEVQTERRGCGPGDIISWEGDHRKSSPSRVFRTGHLPSQLCGPFTLTSSPPYQHHDFFLSYLFIYSVLRFHILLRLSMLLITQGVGCTTLKPSWLYGFGVDKKNSLFPFCFIFEEMFKAYPIMLVFGFASGSTRSGLCASSCLCLS